MTKTIDTLIPDIYGVLEGKGDWTKTGSPYFISTLEKISENRFNEEPKVRDYIGLSSVGKQCDRYFWLKTNQPKKGYPPPAKMLGTFFYGDIIEAYVLALAKAAGHTVEREQETVEVEGFVGHIDAVIDGVPVDVKSANSRNFEKFVKGLVPENDKFGYLDQLGSYVLALGLGNTGAFIPVNKEFFEVGLDKKEFDLGTQRSRLKQIRTAAGRSVAPERLPDVPQSDTSSNRKLCDDCKYCEFRDTCWPNTRAFVYKQGRGTRVEYLTEVVKEPQVTELIR